MSTEAAVAYMNELEVHLPASGTVIVSDVSLKLYPGKILGLVGESGSGKTTTGTALLGYARTGAAINGGDIKVAGQNIREMTWQEVRQIRGIEIGYVPQDPSSALNPAIRIGKQLRELLDQHEIGTPAERIERIKEILPEVGLPNDDEFLRRYPHQLSGGQVQRVALAMVFLPRPKVLVLDEPTTGLDVTTQDMVLQTLDELCERFEVAALYVSHDLAVVGKISDEIAVMYDGKIIEHGPAAEVFGNPQQDYTKALLAAVPNLKGELAAAREESLDQAVLSVADLNVYYGKAHVVHDVSFDVGEREIVALVGESGSGKTTISRCVGGIHSQWDGTISLRGTELAKKARRRTAEQRERIQYIFQNPYQSLNPRLRVGKILQRPLELFGIAKGREAKQRVVELLELVRLDPAMMTLRSNRLSGGERQRVAIARALAVEPEVLICDEITSALDVSIQAAIVDLLNEIKAKQGISMLFVTHDLALARSIADRIMVLQHGRVVELGTASQVLDDPTDPYTQELLAHTPTLDRYLG